MGANVQDLEARLKALEAREAAVAEREAKVAARGKITYRVSEVKKAVSVYGLNIKTPVTLYVQQWERFLADDNIAAFKAWIKANRHLCAVR